MALRTKVIQSIEHVKKSTSQGTGGRSRTIKISTKHMNKNKKRSYKEYRGQGRWMDYGLLFYLCFFALTQWL